MRWCRAAALKKPGMPFKHPRALSTLLTSPYPYRRQPQHMLIIQACLVVQAYRSRVHAVDPAAAVSPDGHELQLAAPAPLVWPVGQAAQAAVAPPGENWPEAHCTQADPLLP